MLDYIEKGSDDEKAYHCMEEFYRLTLNSFQSTNNERLWLKTNIKLARLWLDRKEYGQLSKKLRELHRACQREDGTDDPSKGTYSLEVYALEIQMYAETKNNKRLKALYQRALRVRSAVPHPKIMCIIRECGGKMHISEENWEQAQSDFFESFRNYDEAGSMQRIQVLKYLVLTTMLMKSDINPFDSQETKPYRNDPRISAMTDLVDAFQRDDIHSYEAILSKNQDLLADPFIAENIDEVSRNMRTKAVLKLIAPYTRFNMKFISKQIKISVSEVQEILSFLIMDRKLDAKIDQENGTVVVESTSDVERLRSLHEWSSSLETLWRTVLKDGEGFKAEDGSKILGAPASAMLP
jgi:COP9 signalosome complex subunit 2